MKRADIELGVEYAFHGPMAYGNIPSGVPDKIVFLSRDPQLRLIKTYRIASKRIDPGFNQKTRVGWEEVVEKRRHGKDYFRLPATLYGAVVPEEVEVGFEIEIYEPSSNPTGGLAVRSFGKNGRISTPVLAQLMPAGVHMTWQEYVDDEARKDQARRERQIEQAPLHMRRSLETWYEGTVTLGWTDLQRVVALDDFKAKFIK